MLYLKRTTFRTRTPSGEPIHRTQVIDPEATPPHSPIATAIALSPEKADDLALRAAQAQGIDPADVQTAED